MYCINDFGKIWVLGFIRPEPSVRVDDIYFVVGEGDLQNINYSLYKKYLFVVVHLPEKKTRVFRRFSLGLVPRTQGTLFNGFTKTKHADIKAITYRDEGVEEHIGSEKESYLDDNGNIDPVKIINLTGWK